MNKNTVRNLIDAISEKLLVMRSAKLLSTFDDTIKGLRKVSDQALARVNAKTAAIVKAEEVEVKTIDKAKVKEQKAIVKAEMKRFDKVTKAKDSKVKTVEARTSEMKNLQAIVEQNTRVADKIANLIS